MTTRTAAVRAGWARRARRLRGRRCTRAPQESAGEKQRCAARDPDARAQTRSRGRSAARRARRAPCSFSSAGRTGSPEAELPGRPRRFRTSVPRGTVGSARVMQGDCCGPEPPAGWERPQLSVHDGERRPEELAVRGLLLGYEPRDVGVGDLRRETWGVRGGRDLDGARFPETTHGQVPFDPLLGQPATQERGRLRRHVVELDKLDVAGLLHEQVAAVGWRAAICWLRGSLGNTIEAVAVYRLVSCLENANAAPCDHQRTHRDQPVRGDGLCAGGVRGGAFRNPAARPCLPSLGARRRL
jgi:hypothetical protein